MARRQRTLYEFVDANELAGDESLQPAEEPAPKNPTRSNIPSRVAAALALVAGAVLFAVGVMALRSPMTSVAHDARSLAHVRHTVLPAAPRRPVRHNRARRTHHASAARRRAPRPLTPRVRRHAAAVIRPVAPPAASAPPVVARPVMRRSIVTVRATPDSATEFGFER
jgi:hypothetical protein